MLEFHCAVCRKPSSQSCSVCNRIYYCSKEHQKVDWKTHKPNCSPFKIQANDQLGRYVTATRDIKPGEVVMRKAPIICGPKAASFPLCLGCHRRLNMLEHSYTCSKCTWPMCDGLCEESNHHKRECKIFSSHKYKPCIQKNNSKQIAYAIILPIRALTLKSSDKPKFNTIISLQSHLQLHIETPLYKFLRSTIVPIIKKLTDSDENEILNICSIFDTNSFEIRDSERSINIRGLYPNVSLLSHDCKVNTNHSFLGTDHHASVVATVPIKKGDTITTTYTQTLWCTLSRRAHLRQSKNFLCDCSRCKDPTEFGLYTGSIYCEFCPNQSKLISSDPLDQNAAWKCENCSHTLSSENLHKLNANLRAEILSIDRANPNKFEDFLVKHANILHPTNCHVVEVKYALTQMFGNIQGYRLREISDAVLERKIQLCEELIGIGDVLEPGCSRFREELIGDLAVAVGERNRRLMVKGV